MRFPVDVIGNGAAYRDKFGPGTDHGQPSFRAKCRNDLFETDTWGRLQWQDIHVDARIEAKDKTGISTVEYEVSTC